MQKGIIGKKIGMTQIFDENGKVVPVTVVEAGPCTVVQKKTVESDGYVRACSLASAMCPAKKVNKPAKGHFDKADVAPKRTLREFRLDDISAMNVGDIFKADVFAAGDRVDVVGTSKGKGYAGAIKRWNRPPSARKPRHRPRGPPRRFHGLLLHAVPRVQGQTAAGPSGRRARHRAEP